VEGETEAEWMQRATIAFTRGCCMGLRVISGAEALQFIEKSQRTYEDIQMLKLLHGEENFDMKLITRKWEHFLPEWEFRAFIVNDEITGCTQYYKLCYVPELVANKEKVGEHIKNYFNSIKHLIPITNYTIDFAVSPDLCTTWVIEINHPPPIAGTSLFDWESENDKKIMQEGPYEFRITEKPLAAPLDAIHPPIKHFLMQLRSGSKIKIDPNAFVHNGYACDACHIFPIRGTRHRCAQCSNSYDLCSHCYETKSYNHNNNHKFNPINGLIQSVPPNIPEPEGCIIQ